MAFETDKKTLGERIRHKRKAAGLTQAALGALIGKSESSIAKYESNAAEPPMNVIDKIAKQLRVTRGYLLGYDSKDAYEVLEALKRKDADALAQLMRLPPGSIGPIFKGALYDQVKEVEEQIEEAQTFIDDVKTAIEQAKIMREEVMSKYDLLNRVGREKAYIYISDLAEHTKYLIKGSNEETGNKI